MIRPVETSAATVYMSASAALHLYSGGTLGSYLSTGDPN
jgi:hypothetical protein